MLIGILGFSACKEEVSEITKLDVERAFSPTALQALVVNKTGVRLNFTPVYNADNYTIEIFENANLDFSGTPVKSIPGILATQLPYTISDLDGATDYSVRVKAIGEGLSDSKYVGTKFKTDPEQIFSAVDPATLTATSVVLKWPAGQKASAITLVPGNITRPVTLAEVAAGSANVIGLTGETKYTATLLNGTKTRGTITFTTLIDLGGAIAVYPADNLQALIANATGGETFALFPGTYNINADITISKSISIKGVRPTSKPIISGMVFRLKANVGLSLKDLVLDGTGNASQNQTIVYEDDATTAYGDFIMENCEIKNYVKGLYYVSKKALINSTIFRGNLIHDIECNGGDFIDYRAGLSKTFLFENNTVYNSVAARDLFRMDAGGSTNFPAEISTITIRTNTFNNVINSASNRYLYIRLAKHSIAFTKNIIANSSGYYTNQASTTITTLSGNNYFNAPNFMASAQANAQNDTGTFTTLNPGFTNAATGNFTISNADLKLNGIGDPRWR